ncbi:NAD(P)-dependent alcohol dehydrogenase [Youngiibacter multivorans]|uniref:NADPH:quinone reductase-like Zn-dependent oxidoreductase n=1 Tax=Youngiibacter multivorans TaxID=937251 RepID=A0ABS4G137_9CLOT|nr:NAD(P)-dependent alcohol dehydrogenase [Youngiibacter multivorans]MBP1918251.1 NADPH:quinone reductase-like Zn-dependent oxidoreductase [Youngiibacter multivorans]
MKAVICTRYGGPEVLKIADVRKPIPKDGELLVRVMASAVNTADTRTRGLDVAGPMKLAMRLVLGWKSPRQPILGTVFAGTVEEANTDKFRKGDRVYGCTSGVSYGCHGEFVAVKADGVVAPMPENASFEEAASLLFGGTTALSFLDKVNPEAGQKLLVYGASGAVGTAAVQIGSALGLKVTGAASGANEELVRGLGVCDFIDYRNDDYTKKGISYDIIFDAVGKTSKSKAKLALKPGGSFITVGGASVAKESKSQLDQIRAWFEQGKLKSVIDRVYSLESTAEAHAYVDQGHKKGNVVLKIQS